MGIAIHIPAAVGRHLSFRGGLRDELYIDGLRRAGNWLDGHVGRHEPHDDHEQLGVRRVGLSDTLPSVPSQAEPLSSGSRYQRREPDAGSGANRCKNARIWSRIVRARRPGRASGQPGEPDAA